jgi:hypothetical protein
MERVSIFRRFTRQTPHDVFQPGGAGGARRHRAAANGGAGSS